MWFVARVSPFEWELSTVCNQHCESCDSCSHVDEISDCKCEHSEKQFECHTDFDMHDHSCDHEHSHHLAAVVDKKEQNNFDIKDSFDRYFKNINNIEEINNILMDLEHRQHYLEQQRQLKRNNMLNHKKLLNEYDEDLDDMEDVDENNDLLGNEMDENNFDDFIEQDVDDPDSRDFELISYENEFTLKNCFWWAIGTLIQTSDLNPKVSIGDCVKRVGKLDSFFQ